MINSWGSSSLEEKNYYSQAQLNSIYSPVHTYNSQGKIKNQNVCVIILESFSPEYIGRMNGENKSYTPFLDQLIDSSLFFDHCFANGKKSLDAVPSVLASIPKLMDDEYLLSSYTINKIRALPEILNEHSYSTTFFHGATNGSMNFDSFCELAGFQNYFGRTEYNNDTDFDGTWGIFDEPFLQWTVEKINELPKPFFSTTFTISSHPPYTIPEDLKNKFDNGPTQMHNAIAYSDYALEQFFISAQKSTWYKNTLFIITADHTPASSNPTYSNDIGQMHIPLLFYHPTDSFFTGKNSQVVGQIDIMPSVLELIGHDQPFFAFGHSVFDQKNRYTASQIGGKYLFFGRANMVDYLLVYQNDEPLELFNLEDVDQTINLLNIDVEQQNTLVTQLQAIIQTYNHKMITNQLTISE